MTQAPGGTIEPANIEGHVPTPPLGRGSSRPDVGVALRDYAIVFCLLALFVGLIVSTPHFFSEANFLNVLEDAAPIGIVSLALTYVIIAAEFDLSAGAIVIIAGIVATKTQGSLGTPLALLLGVATGLAAGLVNGVLVSFLRINSFVCTLATGLIIAGLGLVITNGNLITITDPGFAKFGTGELAGITYSVWTFVVVLVLGQLMLTRTVLGRWLVAVGGNQEAARLAGINTSRVKLYAFGLVGLAAGIAGTIIASRTGTGQAGDGIATLLAAFAAVVVGGTSIQGGRGAVWRTFLGVLFLSLIQNGFNLNGVDPIYQQIVQGSVILVAVAADAFSQRRAA